MVGYYTHLDADPFLRQFELSGLTLPQVRKFWGTGAEAFIVRARRRGWVVEQTVDRYAIMMLGLTVWDLYPDCATLVA